VPLMIFHEPVCFRSFPVPVVKPILRVPSGQRKVLSIEPGLSSPGWSRNVPPGQKGESPMEDLLRTTPVGRFTCVLIRIASPLAPRSVVLPATVGAVVVSALAPGFIATAREADCPDRQGDRQPSTLAHVPEPPS
jgi:hypothetical protein